MTLPDIARTILSPDSTDKQCEQALDQFARLCSKISDIVPDPSYTAWAEDTFLNQGVAINPKAAAYCIKDYRRSVVFIRGVYSALQIFKQRDESGKKLKVLYAGCGPFATLILPLLPLFKPDELDFHLLDIHQASLDSVAHLLKALNLDGYDIKLVQGDACQYQHSELLDLIIVETMQKALEQEPQFMVTMNLANQLDANGIFVPEEINVSLGLADLEEESKVYPIIKLIQLSSVNAKLLKNKIQSSIQTENDVLPLGRVTIPDLSQLANLQPQLLTQVSVFGEHVLGDYDASITLPSRCYDLEPMAAGRTYQASYLLGNYPKIDFTLLDEVAKDGKTR